MNAVAKMKESKKSLPRRIDEKDLGKPGYLLSDKALAWLNQTIAADPNHPNKITPQMSMGNLNYTVILTEHHRYAIYLGTTEKALGKGGYGKVKIGQNIDTGEWVSIKIQVIKLNDKTRHEEVASESDFAKEVGILIDKLETKTEHVKKIYLIQKLIGKGDDLFHHLFYADEEDKVISFDEKLDIAISALTELKTKFHDKNIIHRDIKPDNIIFDKSKREVMLIDFGGVLNLNKVNPKYLFLLENFEMIGEMFYGKMVPQTSKGISTSTFYYEKNPVGTEGYMAPEIEHLRKALFSKSSDIYSMGVCLYFLITVNKRDEKGTYTLTIDFYNLVVRMCNYDPRLRPTTDEALNILQQIKQKRIKYENRKKEAIQKPKKVKSKTEKVDLSITLQQAVDDNNIPVLETLLKNKNTHINAKDNKGYTALMHAVENNNVEAIILLFTHKKMDIKLNMGIFPLIKSHAIHKLVYHLVKLKVKDCNI